VRDSSEKPATGVACEDLQRIARPEAEGHQPYLRRDTPIKIHDKINNYKKSSIFDLKSIVFVWNIA